MSKIVCYDVDGNHVDHFTQWDIGQKIVIEGATTVSTPEFHFCNSRSKEALVVSSAIDGESITAEVPDLLLQEALPLTVHMYYETDEYSAKTVYTIVIPVNPRPKPADYTYEEKRTDSLALIGLIYPVGSVYPSTVNASPNDFLIGQWEQIGEVVFENDTVFMWKRVA